MICTPPTAGTCAPECGRPPATLRRRGPVGSGRARLPTRCPPTTRTGCRCASPPRAWLCANAFRVHADISDSLFEELRELCTAAGDKPSLAIGMVGLIGEHLRHGEVREASRLASENMALVESIGEPTLTVGLSLAAISTKIQIGEMAEALRWSQTVIDLATATPSKGT